MSVVRDFRRPCPDRTNHLLVSRTSRGSTPPASSKRSTDVRHRVHIRVTYTGKGQPGPQLGERCDTMADMLVEADAGVIEGTRRGDGSVDIYIATRYPDSTIARARSIARELRIGDRTTVRIADDKGAA